MYNSHPNDCRAARLAVRVTLVAALLCLAALCRPALAEEATIRFAGERKQNNLVSELLEVASISKSGTSLAFTRSTPGWVFISADCQGKGTVKIVIRIRIIAHPYCLTDRTIPLGEDTPPMDATTGQSPSPSELGTWMATWYRPANPGASAAP